MSHITTVSVQITDLQALNQACEELGTVEFKEGQKSFVSFGGARHKCNHAVVQKGNQSARAYSVGLIREKDHYRMQLDNWDSQLTNCVGRNAEQLVEQYTACVTEKDLMMKGFTVSKKKEQGHIHLVATR